MFKQFLKRSTDRAFVFNAALFKLGKILVIGGATLCVGFSSSDGMADDNGFCRQTESTNQISPRAIF